jgi:Domain of unknown function (DUF4440)
MKRFISMLIFLAGSVIASHAQTVPPLESIHSQQELDRTITVLDAQLFDAYNTCNLEKFASLLADDVEFYHDLGGLMVGNKAVTEAVKQNICGKVQRVLVPGTLEAHPMKGYGAVEIGVHRFTHPWQQDHGEVGEAKFIHLWRYKDGAWKITRIISYDHGPAK